MTRNSSGDLVVSRQTLRICRKISGLYVDIRSDEDHTWTMARSLAQRREDEAAIRKRYLRVENTLVTVHTQ